MSLQTQIHSLVIRVADEFKAVYAKIGKALVGEPPCQAIDSPDGLVLPQRAGIKVELFDQLHHDARADRALVPLHQVEIAGGNIQP